MPAGRRAIAAFAVAVAALLAAGDLPAATRSRGKAPRRSRATARRAVRREPPPPSVVVPAGASARDLQVGEACRRALVGARGGVVAMDPHTGRVIAVVNPTAAVQTAYQPCSVFKIVVAVAGLTENVITPSSVYNCAGGCWLWPGHGPVDLRRALADSCNTYFQWVGEKLGYERIEHYAHLLGLGAPSGVNVDGEAAGRLPAAVAPARVAKLSSHAEGIATSAMQLAVLLSATINGGVVFQPQVGGPAGFEPKERWRLPPGTVLGGLAEGFLGAVNEGSAVDAFDPDISVAGKTGTCSGVGWFASFAPAERPELVVVVFLRPGTGHRASAVAGQIYQDLYKGAGQAAGR
ncbi:MAG TPA: penicillin-binding transpeptidase domain-containing protein [Vicinamibacteria bacterium]|jgi:cell division protein FtsI/penicillin-binding protein 2|nr:penicillin-binding transpeptidase domain-containing protein [Vicinamibacteria bacterium]